MSDREWLEQRSSGVDKNEKSASQLGSLCHILRRSDLLVDWHRKNLKRPSYSDTSLGGVCPFHRRLSSPWPHHEILKRSKIRHIVGASDHQSCPHSLQPDVGAMRHSYSYQIRITAITSQGPNAANSWRRVNRKEQGWAKTNGELIIWRNLWPYLTERIIYLKTE